MSMIVMPSWFTQGVEDVRFYYHPNENLDYPTNTTTSIVVPSFAQGARIAVFGEGSAGEGSFNDENYQDTVYGGGGGAFSSVLVPVTPGETLTGQFDGYNTYNGVKRGSTWLCRAHNAEGSNPGQATQGIGDVRRSGGYGGSWYYGDGGGGGAGGPDGDGQRYGARAGGSFTRTSDGLVIRPGTGGSGTGSRGEKYGGGGGYSYNSPGARGVIVIAWLSRAPVEALGPELFPQGTMDTSSGWYLSASNSQPPPYMAGGKLYFDAPAAKNYGAAFFSQQYPPGIVEGGRYRVSVDYVLAAPHSVSSPRGTKYQISMPNGQMLLDPSPANTQRSGTMVGFVTATQSNNYLPFIQLTNLDGEAACVFDNFSVRRVQYQ